MTNTDKLAVLEEILSLDFTCDGCGAVHAALPGMPFRLPYAIGYIGNYCIKCAFARDPQIVANGMGTSIFRFDRAIVTALGYDNWVQLRDIVLAAARGDWTYDD